MSVAVTLSNKPQRINCASRRFFMRLYANVAAFDVKTRVCSKISFGCVLLGCLVDQSDFSKNIKLLCSYEKSVSAVCRAIGINRQQFNKYLNGASKPSSYNLQRICEYFQIQASDIHLPNSEFVESIEARSRNKRLDRERQSQRLLSKAFPGNARMLRRYLGYYIAHSYSPSWPGYILRALCCIYEQEGMFHSKSIERVKDPVDGSRYLSKYDGYVALMGDRIFVVELQSLAEDAIVETVLYPTGRRQLTVLSGITFGMSSKQRHPYVAKTAWKFLGRTVDQRWVMEMPGLVTVNSQNLDPHVAKILGEQSFPNELLSQDLGPASIIPDQ